MNFIFYVVFCILYLLQLFNTVQIRCISCDSKVDARCSFHPSDTRIECSPIFAYNTCVVVKIFSENDIRVFRNCYHSDCGELLQRLRYVTFCNMCNHSDYCNKGGQFTLTDLSQLTIYNLIVQYIFRNVS